LQQAHTRLRGVVLNRMHLWPDVTPANNALITGSLPQPDIDALASALGDAEAAGAAVRAAERVAAEVKRDTDNTRILRDHAEKECCFFREIAEEPHDIHDLQTLSAIADALVHPGEVANP
jgi:hypothetical protein